MDPNYIACTVHVPSFLTNSFENNVLGRSEALFYVCYLLVIFKHLFVFKDSRILDSERIQQ